MDSLATSFVGLTVAVVVVAATAVWYYLTRLAPRLAEAKPSEWLIVIRNGEQRLAGVGLKAWVYPMETSVSFPSVLTKVSFEAMQTTKEMQGVRVIGFAIFNVLRTDDGPFRYYKYVQGAGDEGARDNLKSMAESLMRKHVATTALNDVLCDREVLRQSVRDEMLATTKGWGVWLETLEIQEVRICSKALFEDLQAEFRQDTHLRAEQLRLESSKALAEHQSVHSQDMAALNAKTALATAQSQAEQRTAVDKLEGDAKLARMQAAQQLAAEELTIQMQAIETSKQLELAKQQQADELARQKEEFARARDLANHQHKLQMRREELAVDTEMTGSALAKYQMDQTAAIYKALPLREFKVNTFVAPDTVAASAGGLAGLLPAIGAMAGAAQGSA